MAGHVEKLMEYVEKARGLGSDIHFNDMLFIEYALETNDEKFLIETLKENPAAVRWHIDRVKFFFPDVYAEHIEKFLDAAYVNAKGGYNHDGFRALRYLSRGNYAKADKYFNLATNFYLYNINPVTRQNYIKLAGICKERNIKLVVMQYPLRSAKPLKHMLKGHSEITFVSNEENFRQALKSHSIEEIFHNQFAGDFGHATDLGNRLIAENLARTLAEIIK